MGKQVTLNNKKKFHIGAHASISKGMKNALISIEEIGGNAIQIFLKSPRARASKPLDETQAKEAKKYLKEKELFLVGHCSYILNFAKPFEENLWAVESLVDDLTRIEKLGGIGVVLHIGKYLEYSKEEAFNNIKININKVLKFSPKNTHISLENTAGQGTEIGFKLEELAELYESLEKHPRIKFCIDTCHAHAAGYNLSNKEGLENFKTKFDNLLGIKNIVCIHLNDCKKEAGCRVDRHEDKGFGTIGKDGIKEVVQFAKKANIPLILETPSRDMSYVEQISLIKSFK